MKLSNFLLVLALCLMLVQRPTVAQEDDEVTELTDEDFAAAAGELSDLELLVKGYLDGAGEEGKVDPIKDSAHFEGDIKFPDGLNIWSYASPVDVEDSTVAGSVDSAVRGLHKIWTNAVVPFELRGTFTRRQRLRIAEAIGEYNKHTCIQWKPRRGEKDFVYLYTAEPGTGCWSHVGKSGGGQPINLEPGCYTKGVVMHEMMHAVGFFHEQSRADRDDYVTILLKNVIKDKDHNFKRYSLSEIQHLGTKYDCSSLMHYGDTAFAKERGLKTIVPKSSSCVIVGHRDDFSDIDKLDLNRLYKCPGATPRPTRPPPPPPPQGDFTKKVGFRLYGHYTQYVVNSAEACWAKCEPVKKCQGSSYDPKRVAHPDYNCWLFGPGVYETQERGWTSYLRGREEKHEEASRRRLWGHYANFSLKGPLECRQKCLDDRDRCYGAAVTSSPSWPDNVRCLLFHKDFKVTYEDTWYGFILKPL